MLKSLSEVQSEREEQEYMDGPTVYGMSGFKGLKLELENQNLNATNALLRSDLRMANKEIDRLREAIRDLEHDLEGTIKDCNAHHNFQE